MHFFFSGAAKKPSTMLDGINATNVVGAFSLRQLTKKATSAIRVRRSSDNIEQNIGFAGNDLDTPALLNFVGTENYLFPSESIAGNATNMTESLDTGIAPDGTTTADTATGNAGTAVKQVRKLYSTTTTGAYTLSVYLKYNTEQYVVLRITDNGGVNDVRQRFDLLNGQLNGAAVNGGTATGAAATITDVGSGWYRCTVTCTFNSALTSLQSFVYLTVYGSTASTNAFDCWGWQLNSGSNANLYNKTTVGIGGNGFVTTWYNQVTGTNDLVQTTANDQPRIVLAGTLFLMNGKPSAEFYIAGESNMGLLSNFGNVSTFYDAAVFQGYSGMTSPNRRITNATRNSSTTSGTYVSAATGTVLLSINNSTPAAPTSVPAVFPIAPSILTCSYSTQFVVPLAAGNVSGFPRNWYGSISELIYYKTAAPSAADTLYMVKNQAKYYGITLV